MPSASSIDLAPEVTFRLANMRDAKPVREKLTLREKNLHRYHTINSRA